MSDELAADTPAHAILANFRPDGYGAAVHDVFVDGVIVGTHVSGRWAFGGAIWVAPTFHPAPPPGGPQTHPRPGDTMTCPDGYVYTVDRVVGNVEDPYRCTVYCNAPEDTADPARWPLWLWSVEDGSVWARPA